MKSLFTLIFIGLIAFGSQAQVEQTVVVEHFTNTLCGNCASRNPAFYDLLDDYSDVIHISYHPSAPYPSCVLHQHNAYENDARAVFYGAFGGTPTAVVQGNWIGFQNPILSAQQLEAYVGKTSDYKLRIYQEQLEADMVHVSIKIKRVSNAMSQPTKLFAIIAEKDLYYAAPNGESVHHEVFRKVLIDQFFDLPAVGDSIVINTSYTLHGDWSSDEMIVTAMIHDSETNAVLQANESSRLGDGSSAIGEQEVLSLDGILYPNPATDVINISSSVQEQFIQADLYAMTGNKVKSFSDPTQMRISDLPEGIYMIVLTGTDQKLHVGRIIKR